MLSSRRWFVLAAVVAVVAVVAGCARPGDGSPAAGPSASAAVEVSASAGARQAGLVVRDGARVQASGAVVAEPGKPVRFCAPAPVVGGEGDVPGCAVGVPVTGVDLDRLTDAGKQGTVRFGWARLRGVWQQGTLRVAEQEPPEPATPEPELVLPCPAPAGGWQRGPLGDTNRLIEYVEGERSDRFRRPWVTYPDGTPRDETQMATATEVMVVEVVRGDIGEARAELAKRYAGNLCVVAAPAGARSLAEQSDLLASVQPALTRIMEDPANGVYASSGGDTVVAEMLMLTPALHEKLTAISPGIEASPWLRPG